MLHPARILVCALLCLLAGCSTLSESECRTVDWFMLGQKDGAAGYERNNRLAQHYDACTKAGIQPEQSQYTSGWQRGIVQYCTPESAFQAGRSGQSYNGVCLPSQDRLFRLNHDLGRRVYDLDQLISKNDREIRELERKLENKDTKDSERPSLRERIRQIDRTQALLRDSKRHAETATLYR